jgi:hypothetical protein
MRWRHSLGKNPAERRFREWALKERLFLNGLNHLGPFPIAARDVIQLPSIVTGFQQGPTFHAFFNQLKQEYAAARWLCFEALFPNSAAGAAAAIALTAKSCLWMRASACGLRNSSCLFALRIHCSIKSPYS